MMKKYNPDMIEMIDHYDAIIQNNKYIEIGSIEAVNRLNFEEAFENKPFPAESSICLESGQVLRSGTVKVFFYKVKGVQLDTLFDNYDATIHIKIKEWHFNDIYSDANDSEKFKFDCSIVHFE